MIDIFIGFLFFTRFLMVAQGRALKKGAFMFKLLTGFMAGVLTGFIWVEWRAMEDPEGFLDYVEACKKFLS